MIKMILKSLYEYIDKENCIVELKETDNGMYLKQKYLIDNEWNGFTLSYIDILPDRKYYRTYLSINGSEMREISIGSITLDLVHDEVPYICIEFMYVGSGKVDKLYLGVLQ